MPESSVPEAVWEIEYSELVPDLYPELSDSLKMQESDTEHDDRAKGNFSLFHYSFIFYLLYFIIPIMLWASQILTFNQRLVLQS